MRLPLVEEPLKQAVYQFIQDLFPEHADRAPQVYVFDDNEYSKVTHAMSLTGVYDIRENALYFCDWPTPFTVVHEVYHWFQAQEVGPEEFIEQCKDWKVMLKYEKAANDVAIANAPRLKWGRER